VCPLFADKDCCAGLWQEMRNRRTWREFLPAMDRVIVFIAEKYVEAKAKEE
jgi:hypothetical protein